MQNHLLSQALFKHGIEEPKHRIQQGKFTRWGKNNRYWATALQAEASLQEIYVFGDWSTGMSEVVLPTGDLTDKQRSDIAAIQKKAAEERKEMQRQAAFLAQKIFEAATPIITVQPQSYLGRKKIPALGIKKITVQQALDVGFNIEKAFYKSFWENENEFIVVPLKNAEDTITSVQFISNKKENNKRYLPSACKQGSFHVIAQCKRPKNIYVGEGYATMASIHLATGEMCVCACDAHNLRHVSLAVRKLYPDAFITVCADNDSSEKGNIGVEIGTQAAAAIKAKLIYPETKGDFNDLHCEKKLEAFLKKNKQRFIIYDLEKFMNLELPPDEMVIDPIMPVGGIMLLYAKPGVGKSMVTLSIAHGIASGTNALCWNMPKPRCVLYVDGEMDGRDVQRRLRNFIAGSGIEFNPENFRYLNLRLQEKENQSPDFSAKIIQNAIEEELKGVDVLILDNLSTLTKCKENDSDEWVRMQDWLLGLRSKRVSTIVVHHAGKLGSQRGTSRKEDVMDTVIALKKETEGGGSGFKVKIEYDKCRGFGGANANPFVATLIELPNKGVKWAVNQEKRDERDIVRELFSIGMNVKDITEETGLSKATIYRIKKEYNNGK